MSTWLAQRRAVLLAVLGACALAALVALALAVDRDGSRDTSAGGTASASADDVGATAVDSGAAATSPSDAAAAAPTAGATASGSAGPQAATPEAARASTRDGRAECVAWAHEQGAALVAATQEQRPDVLREVLEVAQGEVEAWSGPSGGPGPEVQAVVTRLVAEWQAAIEAYDAGAAAAGDRGVQTAAGTLEELERRADVTVMC